MSVQFSGVKAILLDIEGTVCHISFVKDVLFPFALDYLERNLENLWNTTSFHPYMEAFPASIRTHPALFFDHIRNLISTDSKEPCLKNLQGYLWRNGYEDGSLRCPLFSDVVPMLQKWHEDGLRILIYSSGSVQAQKLLFEYTNHGDLRPLLSGYFDTLNAGSKTKASSYSRILTESVLGILDPSEWLFCSDSTLEVEAAVAAGLRALVVVRQGNKTLSSAERAHCQVIESLDQIDIIKNDDGVEK